MILSVLIPSIPERLAKASYLISRLNTVLHGYDAEILLLCDNLKMSIGEKRERLKNLAKGDYFCFVDDDDTIYHTYKLLADATIEGKDVITFKQQCVIDGFASTIDFDLTHTKNEDWKPNETIKRMPFHVCAWRREKFQNIPFDFINYGEDWTFCDRALKIAQSQTKINEVIHKYNFNSELSRAEN